MSRPSSETPSPQPSAQPFLTPQFCFNTTALRDFLRLSRATVDDSISAHLNALLTPSSTNPFAPHPGTTDTAPLQPPTRGSRRNIPSATCNTFKCHILFPSWSARSSVLTYCARVAESAEAEAPLPASIGTSAPAASAALAPSQMSKQRATQPAPTPSEAADHASPVTPTALPLPRRTTRNYWGREQVVDERLDPYSARDYEWTRETRAQELRECLRNEEGVERIVRARTWGVLAERCVEGAGAGRGVGVAAEEGWEGEWRAWRRRQGLVGNDERDGEGGV